MREAAEAAERQRIAYAAEQEAALRLQAEQAEHQR